MRWLALLFIPAIAHAGVELGAQAGVDSSDGASAAGSAAVELIGAPRPCDPACVIWGDAPDLLRAEASATLARSSYGDARVTGRWFGWQLVLGETVQPLGSLRDEFWRSGRGLDDATIGVAMPAFVSAAGIRVIEAAETIDLDSNGDADFALGATTFAGRHWALFRVAATSRTRGDDREADQLVFDLLALDVTRDGNRVQLEAGIDSTCAFEEPIDHEIDTPRYWLDVSRGFGELSAKLGAGSWARLDPTGDAVDTGQLATGELAWRHGRYAARAAFDAGRLVRRFGAPVPPRAMGRAELEGDVQLAHSLAMVGTAWAERSDRDDPRWAVPANGSVMDHAGVGVAARWQLKNVTALPAH
ncbi:MAG TPA: hypothetical protein VH143_31220 [Kofleriaceae bacterium]|nr:hypothetical protein [Kofleriaceae bacterium]